MDESKIKERNSILLAGRGEGETPPLKKEPEKKPSLIDWKYLFSIEISRVKDNTTYSKNNTERKEYDYGTVKALVSDKFIDIYTINYMAYPVKNELIETSFRADSFLGRLLGSGINKGVIKKKTKYVSEFATRISNNNPCFESSVDIFFDDILLDLLDTGKSNFLTFRELPQSLLSNTDKKTKAEKLHLVKYFCKQAAFRKVKLFLSMNSFESSEISFYLTSLLDDIKSLKSNLDRNNHSYTQEEIYEKRVEIKMITDYLMRFNKKFIGK